MYCPTLFREQHLDKLRKQPATEVAGFIVGRDNAYPRH